MKTHLTPDTAIAFIGAVFLVATVVGLMVDRAIQRYRLRSAVYGNLDAALDGGQFETDLHFLHGMNAEELAYCLTLYAPDLELENAETLVPYVLEWLQRKQEEPTRGGVA